MVDDPRNVRPAGLLRRAELTKIGYHLVARSTSRPD